MECIPGDPGKSSKEGNLTICVIIRDLWKVSLSFLSLIFYEKRGEIGKSIYQEKLPSTKGPQDSAINP